MCSGGLDLKGISLEKAITKRSITVNNPFLILRIHVPSEIWESSFSNFCHKESEFHLLGETSAVQKDCGEKDLGNDLLASPTPSYPLPRSATSARWPCAFLNHQLQLWSCSEAMHRGTWVSAFVFIFDCLFLFLSNLSPLVMVCGGMERSRCLVIIIPALIRQSSLVTFKPTDHLGPRLGFITVTAHGFPCE